MKVTRPCGSVIFHGDPLTYVSRAVQQFHALRLRSRQELHYVNIDEGDLFQVKGDPRFAACHLLG